MKGLTVKLLLKMLEQQQGRCAMSGRELTPENCTLDHIEPRAMGGADGFGNLQLVTEETNKAKGTLTRDEFVRLCCDVADWSRRGVANDSASLGVLENAAPPPDGAIS